MVNTSSLLYHLFNNHQLIIRPIGFTEKEDIPKSDSDCESSDEPVANPNHLNFAQESDDDSSGSEEDTDESGESSDQEEEATEPDARLT